MLILSLDFSGSQLHIYEMKIKALQALHDTSLQCLFCCRICFGMKLLKMNETYYSVMQIYTWSISRHIQNLIEIHKIMHKILSINKILMSIKGHNAVKN